MKKNVKQLLSALLVIAMMATLLIVPAAAEDLTGAVGDEWSFIKSDYAGGVTEYNGLTFSQAFTKNGDQHGMDAKPGTITIPVEGPCNIEVVPSYKWDLTLGDTTHKDSPNGENTTPYVFPYTGEKGTATLTINSQSYIRSIAIRAPGATMAVSTKEVVVTEGETGSFDVTVNGGEPTAWAYEVGDDTMVTDVTIQEGKVSFTAAKAGVSNITVTATVDDEELSETVSVCARLADVGTVAAGEYDFRTKEPYYTTPGFTWEIPHTGNDHGPYGQTGGAVTVHVPEGKLADLDIVTCQWGNGGTITATSGTVGAGTQATEGEQATTTPVTGASGDTKISFSSQVYVHAINVTLRDESSASLSVSPTAVTMRAKESKEVTATATGYDESMKLFAVSADEKTATATVGEDGATITITGVAAGSTTVYAVMADTEPTLEAVQAEDSGAKTVAVTVEEALPEGVKEWNFKVANADALPAAMEGLTSEAGTASKPAQYHGTTYGLYYYAGNIIGVPVDGPSKITLYTGYTWYIGLGTKQMATQYGATENMLSGDNGKDVETVLTYTGGKGVVYLTALPGGTSYLAGIKVEPLGADFTSNAVDVWDFGAEQMDAGLFVNHLTESVINAWYPDETPGTSNVTVPVAGLAADGLKFNTGEKTNNRLRTSNENLTRYDSQTKLGAEGADPYTSEVTLNEDGSVKGGKTYPGLVYSNNSSTNAVNLTLEAKAGDKITYVSGSNGGAATYSFADAEGTVLATAEYAPEGSINAKPLTFYAPADGTYTYYTDNEKLVVCRVYRESGVKTTVSGTVDTSKAPGIADTFSVVFTGPGGVVTKAEVKDGAYTAELNNYLSGAEYTVSLEGADGFVVATGDELTLESTQRTADHPVVVAAVDLVKITGKVTGLDEADLANLVIEVTKPEDKIFLPKIVPAADGTYETSFEKGVEYTLTAHNVNDYTLTKTSVSYTADGTADVVFEAKPTYTVTMAPDPETVDLSAATITFTNVDEVDDAHPDGYVYTFTGASGIKLRDAQYVVKVEGISAIQKLTPDLVISGANNTCTVPFQVGTPTLWDFSDPSWTAEVAATNAYNGLVLSGIQNNKTYALGNTDSTIQIPVDGPCSVTVSYCYAADGIIGDVPFSTTSGSTSTIESTTYAYTGEAGIVELKTNSTTYITKIEVIKSIPYKDTVTVGVDKDYKTINEALAAVKQMERTDEQRVTVLIDPGDYQEMLRVDVANVTLKNASATPSIELTNKGVDIDPNAVRITHYYGHGYAYYSMEKDCTYSAERLAVNKANGRLSFENPGTGTTSGSYWNATVSIMASGFQAEGIIFENSFNQYVSELAAQDVIVKLAGAKEGAVPRAEMKAGDTTVQEKAYVERAAALAIYNNCKEIFFDNCKFIGRQDTLYGGTGTTAGFYDCAILGGTDYIFGGMNAVFAKCDLVFNTSEDKNDVGYITAPQQSSGRGYLMYNCHVTSTTPGVDTASALVSKPGYFGRPWATNTGEAVFYATDVDHTDPSYYTGDTAKGTSMIQGAGWLSSLSGESALCGDFGTVEYYEGADTSADRAKWAAKFDKAETADGASMTDTAAWLGGWDAFAGKDMEVKNQTPKAFDAEVLKDELAAAIKAAKDAYKVADDTEGLVVADDVTAADVARGDKFVNAKDMDAFQKAIDAAQAVYDKADATATDVLAAQKALAAAVAAFDAAQQTGTKAPDTDALTKALDAAAAAKKDVAISAGPASQVEKDKKFAPKAAMDALNEAIRQAQVVANSVAATQADVDDAAKALNDAITAFNAAVDTGTNEGGDEPTPPPSEEPSEQPSEQPSDQPSEEPSDQPTDQPSEQPGEPTATINGKTEMSRGSNQVLTVTVTNGEKDSVYWTSSDATVLTVEQTGKVTAVKAGTATVTAAVTLKDGTVLTATIDITVKAGVSGNTGGVSGGTGSTNQGGSTTDKNYRGDKVTTVTTAAGGKTVTVTDANGEVVAKVVVPAQTPDLGYVFEDVADSFWAKDAIYKAAGMGIFQGVSTAPHLFDTTGAVTRGMVAQMLYNLSQGKAGIDNPFADSKDAWYSDAVAWAAAADVVEGTSDTTFAPNQNVTREQLVTMLYRYAQLLNGDTTAAGNINMTQFNDTASISSWATQAVEWAVSVGLLQGRGNGKLDPTATATRAEAAAIMSRFVAFI